MIWVYEKSEDDSCCYSFGKVLKAPLICVGLHPGADELCVNTFKSVERIAIENGYSRWCMVNLYPQRAAKLGDLGKVPTQEYIDKNIMYIDEILSKYPNSEVWAAWGTGIEDRKYLKDSLARINGLMTKHSCKWITFGDESKDGHPHHPLYLKRTSQKKPFEMTTYFTNL